MKLAISTALVTLVGLVASANVARKSCPEASRFGDLTVTPLVFKPGDPINLFVDLTCAVENFGIVPKFIDYTIQVIGTSNNGFEQPIVLARHTIRPGALSDTVNTTIPHAFFFAGAPYQIETTVIYPISGTNGDDVLLEGGVLFPITINA